MLLAIIQNPHTKDPQELWKLLNSEDTPYYEQESLDKVGFELLKLKMADNPRIKIK